MGFWYVAAARTDIGNAKNVNQDSLTLKVAKTSFGEAVIAVLCDGMGGLQQGEVASAVVVRAYERWFMDELSGILRYGFKPDEIKKAWNDISLDCNSRISEYAKKINASMGTTLTVLLIADGCYYIAHVGDCRVYSMNDNINQITADQTYVAREVALGHMTWQQAKNDSRRNVILQCIGTGRELKPEFLYGKVQAGDSFLLCSDGFRHEVSDDEIYKYCHEKLVNTDWKSGGRHEKSRQIGTQLENVIELNKKRGEHDNISAILIKALQA
jgi:serine/threonine protein phosphatase PrpC